MQIHCSGVFLLLRLMAISRLFLQSTAGHTNTAYLDVNWITGLKMNRQKETDTSLILQEPKLLLFIC